MNIRFNQDKFDLLEMVDISNRLCNYWCWGCYPEESELKNKTTVKTILITTLILILTGMLQSKKEVGMYGIVFFKTQKLAELQDFYLNKAGCELWLEQADCLILRSGNMLFGFCQREQADLQGMITFFYDQKERVDRAYKQFRSTAVSPPKMNEKYGIYHFFARDPEGRMIEFQYFVNEINWNFKPVG
jgi:hypothetical protein